MSQKISIEMGNPMFSSGSKSLDKQVQRKASQTSSLGAMSDTIHKILELSSNQEDKTTEQELIDELNERPDDWSIFSDEDWWKRIWNIMVLILVMYTVVIIPLNFAFPSLDETPALDYTIDVLFVIDVVLNFRTAYLDHNGDEVWDLKEIRQNYLALWFWIDLVATFPMEIVLVIGGVDTSETGTESATRTKLLLRLLKVPRLLRVGRIFKMLNQGRGAGAWRMGQTVFGLIILTHWFGCSFYFICRMELEAGVADVWPDYLDTVDSQERDFPKSFDLGKVYLSALLTAMYMLIGEGVGPTTTLEMFFVFFAMVVGAIVLSYLIGNISLVLSNANAISAKHSAKMDEVLDSMRAMKVTATLQRRIVAYYDLLWQRHRFLSTKESFIDELSPPLRKEVHLDLNKHVIAKCQLFRGLLDPKSSQESGLSQFLTDEEAHQILVSIVDGLKPEVYLLGDSIIAQGEMGREMFFLVKGLVDIVKFNNQSDAQEKELYDPLKESSNIREISTKILTLGAGSYFGELALLRDASQGLYARRAASIIAVTPCDTQILTKDIFDRIVQDFPGLWVYLSSIAAKKYKMPNLLKDSLRRNSSQSAVGKSGNSTIQRPDAQDPSSQTFNAGQLAALSQQLARVEKIVGSMSHRIGNIEKCLPGLMSPTSKAASLEFHPSDSFRSSSSSKKPRRGTSSRGGRRGGLRAHTQKIIAARRLSMPDIMHSPPQGRTLSRIDI